jgi:replication factor A1
VYLIGNCVVKSANKKFSSVKNDYEISFNRDTFMQEVEDAADVPEISYDMKPIGTIKDTAVDEIVDVVAVCHSCNEVQTIITRATSKELQKREVTLVDETNFSVTLTMWGKDAEDFSIKGNPIIAIRKAKVGEYQNSKNISLLMSSAFVVSFPTLFLLKPANYVFMCAAEPRHSRCPPFERVVRQWRQQCEFHRHFISQWWYLGRM